MSFASMTQNSEAITSPAPVTSTKFSFSTVVLSHCETLPSTV
jgi:hypothetical protein